MEVQEKTNAECKDGPGDNATDKVSLISLPGFGFALRSPFLITIHALCC